MNYNNFEIEAAIKNRDRAASMMDSSQRSLDDLGRMKREDSLKLIDRLYAWQEWLGAACFALAAVGGVVFIASENISPYVGLGVFILLIDGVFITLKHKLNIERDLAKIPLMYDSTMPQFLDKKKAAFESWNKPESVSAYISTLEAEKDIQKLALKTLKANKKEVEGNLESSFRGVNYSSDIFVWLLFTGLYLLLKNFFSQLYLSVSVLSTTTWGFIVLYFTTYMIISFFILRSALKSKDDAIAASQSKLGYYKSSISHSEKYIKEINNNIEETKKQYKN